MKYNDSRGINFYKHGMSKTPFWNKWIGIIQRCNDKNVPSYKYYGGRGISVCKKWNDFESFCNDMYESYLKHCKEFGEKDTSIDRINNNGNYEKNNCRWATRKEQCRNRRSNKFIEFNNKKLCLKDWSLKTGIKYRTLHQRIFESGWSIKSALTIIPKK